MSACCIPETNIILYVNYTSKKEKKSFNPTPSQSEKCQSPFSLQKEGVTCLTLSPVSPPFSLCTSYFGLLVVSQMFQLAPPQRFWALVILLPEHFSLRYLWVYAAAAAAKSHQSCSTLCDPIDGSPPGSRPWDSPGKNTGVGCHFPLHVKV